ncbi:putative acyl-CoA synthetase [Ixodes scapularis]
MSDQSWPRLRQAMRFWRRGDNTGAAAPLENEEAEAPMLLPARSDWRWSHFPQAFRFWRPTRADERAPPLRNGEGEPPLEEQPLEALILNRVLHPPAWLTEQYQVREATIPQLVQKRLQELSDHPVAVVDNVEFKGADVLKMIRKYATMFQDRGVGPGVHVWAMLSNSLENLAASLAVIFIGGVLYLTGYAQTDDDTVKRLGDSAAMFVLMEKKSVTRVRSLLATHFQDRAQRYNDLVLGPDAGMIDTFAVPDDAISFKEHIPVSSAEIAVVLHTSGYSASQKAVEITHKAYACAFESYRLLNHIDQTDVFLAWTPLHHVFGFSLNAFSMLLGALTVFEEPTIDYEELTALVIRHKNLFTYLAASLEDDSSSSGDEKRDFDVYSPRSNSCIGFVLYTPGYTGPPKGVEFSHRAYVTAFRICRTLGHVGEGDVYLAWSPLAHAFGFTLNVFPMFLGAVVVFQEPTLTFREFKNVLETRYVTAMFCFPKMILRVFQEAKERKRTAGDWRRTYRFPAVNKILVGGQWIPEHLPKKLMDRFGCQRLWRYYGLTETLGVVVESEYTGNAMRFRGFVVPKVRAKYMPSSDEYEPCPPGIDGELCVMSPTMMTGYYKCKEKAAAGGQPPQFGGGDKYGEDAFLRTGDYGWCNHKGYIELHGKVGDIMSLSGLTVLPHELEDALRGLTFIKEICVFGSLSESVPGAVIVPKYDLDIEDCDAERQVADFLRRRGAACLTGGLCFIESIPRLEDGRILRRAIRVIQKLVGVSRPPSVEP